MKYDLITVISIYMYVNYICTIILGLAWYRTRYKYEGIKFVFIDFIFQSFALTLASLQMTIPSIYSVVLANILMYTGAIFLLIGVAKFLNVGIPKMLYIISSVVFALLYYVFTLGYPNTQIRLIIFTLMSVPVFIHTIYVSLYKADRQHRRFAIHVSIAHIFFALAHSARAYIGLNKFQFIEYNSLHQLESIFIMVSLLLMVYLTFSITQMIHMKLLYQLDQAIENIIKTKVNMYKNFECVFSVLMVDIDHFKRFNDQYGHDFGDQIIIRVTQELKTHLRSRDSVGRWGGEEFLIVLDDTDVNTAKMVGEKLIKMIELLAIDCNGIKEKVTVSMGCTQMKRGDTLNTLIKHADMALYLAKDNGRNRIEIMDENINFQ